MTWKIVADSGCDYRQLATPAIDTEFVSVPLTIRVADQVFIDDANLDIDHMRLQNQLVLALMITCVHLKVQSISLSLPLLVLFQVAIIALSSLRTSTLKNTLTLRFM